MKLILGLLALTCSAVAGEYAVLSSGARLRVDRHEFVEGDKVRLYSNDGMTELLAQQVTGFEAEDYTPPPAVVAPSPKAAATPQDLVDKAILDYGLRRELVRSLVAAESGFKPEAVSPKGAIGLMQLMPGTARMYGADPRNAEQNVNAGAQYFRELLEKYNGDAVRALAAYNAGPGAVDKYHGIPPYPETQAYVSRVIHDWLKREAKAQDHE